MSALLMVMNPRRVPDCMAALKKLSIDKAWMRCYTERQLCAVVPDVIARTDYTYYLTCSDDFLVEQLALDAVIEALEDGHPAVTGHAPLDQNSPLVNITRTPIRISDEGQVSYDWYMRSEVRDYPEPLLPTGFGGMTLTGMSRELWQRFPFQALPGGYGPPSDGCCSDLLLSHRLSQAGIQMVAPKAAFVDHIKTEWNRPDPHPERQLLIGQAPSGVRLETETGTTDWDPLIAATLV